MMGCTRLHAYIARSNNFHDERHTSDDARTKIIILELPTWRVGVFFPTKYVKRMHRVSNKYVCVRIPLRKAGHSRRG